MSAPDQMSSKTGSPEPAPAVKGLAIPSVTPGPEGAPSTKVQLEVAETGKRNTGYAFAPVVHGYLWSSILLAEQKGAFVFAVDCALLAYLFKVGLLLNLIKNFPHWVLHDYLGSLTALLSGASVAAVVTVVMPRLGGASKGLIYFGSIASRSGASVYAEEVAASSEEQLNREMLGHCYELAAIAKRKFSGVRIAMWLGILGFAVSLVFLSL